MRRWAVWHDRDHGDYGAKYRRRACGSGVTPEILRAQIDVVVSGIGVDAVKIGMLHSPEIVQVVADALRQYAFKKWWIR